MMLVLGVFYLEISKLDALWRKWVSKMPIFDYEKGIVFESLSNGKCLSCF